MDLFFEAKDITLKFGGLTALDRLTVTINEGEILGLIGSNGSGKTTFINVLTGIYSSETGSVMLKGERIDHLSTHKIAEKGIARTFQNLRIFGNLTVLDNVVIGRHYLMKTNIVSIFLRPVKHFKIEREAKKKAIELLDFLGLAHKSNAIAKNLPYGEQRRLELARALATDPCLLLLDEPTAGMNPRECLTMIGLLKEINNIGKTLIIIEHNMRMVMNVSDRILVLNAGKSICEGNPLEVQKDRRVQECYLGKEET